MKLGRVVKLATSRSGRASLHRGAIFELARRAELPGIGVEHDGMFFFVDPSDLTVGRATFRHGAFELETMSAIMQLLEQAGGRGITGRHFIDIGANIGTSIVPACLKFGAAGGLAVEPSSTNFRMLQLNLAANELTGHVEAVKKAVSNKCGTTTLELSETNSGDHRIRVDDARSASFGEESRAVQPVDVVTLDSLAGAVTDPGLIWIDTQGHESQVLAGGHSLAHVPAVIEYWPYALRRAGGLGELHDIIGSRYRRIIDARKSAEAGKAVDVAPTSAGLVELASRYSTSDLATTDLLLLP